MLSTECYIGDGLRPRHDFNGGWDIIEARGIPNCGRRSNILYQKINAFSYITFVLVTILLPSFCSDDSAVWVLGWMDMEYAFNPNFSGSVSMHISFMIIIFTNIRNIRQL